MKRKMSKLKIFLLIVLVVVLAAAVALKLVSSNMEKGMNQLLAAEVATINLSTIEDGEYPGAYKTFPIDVKVLVKVEDHTITGIDLVKHFNGQGGAAEVIVDDVVEAQSLQVDTISGATYSSKVIPKAIEDALL